MASNVILVDAGNTSTLLALSRNGRFSRKTRLPSRRLSSADMSTALNELTRGSQAEGAVLCSVVPSANRTWLSALKKQAGISRPLLVNHEMKLDIKVGLPKPEEVGADRLANACAVAHFHGTPAIVIDFGTAVTFDLISKTNEYIGGVIAPGLPVMTDYFADRTALLPRLAWKRKGAFYFPARKARRGLAFGKNTIEAMMVGAEIGYLGMVREILDRLRLCLGGRDVKLLATGGYAKWVLAESDIDITMDPDLTLRGMRRVYDLNC